MAKRELAVKRHRFFRQQILPFVNLRAASIALQGLPGGGVYLLAWKFRQNRLRQPMCLRQIESERKRHGDKAPTPYLHNRGLASLGSVRSILLIILGLQVITAAPSEAFIESTYLLDIKSGSSASDMVRRAGDVSYELADGTPVELRDWYRTDVPEISVEFLTELGDNLGLVWGFRTGEDGENYRITPGIKIGFVYQAQLTKNSTLSVSATTQLGSILSEGNCTADYGEIGGVQAVNCRLAASVIPPEETLKYNLRAKGRNESQITVRYLWLF